MLKLSDVCQSYGSRRVITNLSLSAVAGSVTALLGPNGAGKSTLLDICLGWLRPESGTVAVQGKNVTAMGAAERGRIISLVPQRENLRFDFPVEDYVLLGRSPYLPPLGLPGKEDRRIAAEAMEAVGIAHLKYRPITKISGGEYQLTLIARSLAQQPRLLLLDEPTSQLDPAHRLEVLRVLRRLSKLGITILLTSHSPETASLIADTVYLLNTGSVVAAGRPREIITGENMEKAYGVPFRVSWNEDQPIFLWDL